MKLYALCTLHEVGFFGLFRRCLRVFLFLCLGFLVLMSSCLRVFMSSCLCAFVPSFISSCLCAYAGVSAISLLLLLRRTNKINKELRMSTPMFLMRSEWWPWGTNGSGSGTGHGQG
ncbi:hypothetical protein BDP27DRAFT_728882 [Rhodocollybia butyracea]|uniref:Transmembrane protein n=1 Tax=Rhodocollybia butyracea TaxID=206335 RepID=A0A9P5P576_9AGAR|nr:hypothetical protein BDP27DRAFT_728882 [Rhodocollybia butyracea]